MTARKFISLAAAATMVVTSFGAAVPAFAHDGGYREYRGGYDRYERGYDRRDYRDYRRYEQRRAYAYGNRYDRYNRYDRCRDSGAGGTIIGAVAGGLAGHELAGRRGDRTAGTIIGGAIGAIAGRAIDKSNSRC